MNVARIEKNITEIKNFISYAKKSMFSLSSEHCQVSIDDIGEMQYMLINNHQMVSVDTAKTQMCYEALHEIETIEESIERIKALSGSLDFKGLKAMAQNDYKNYSVELRGFFKVQFKRTAENYLHQQDKKSQATMASFNSLSISESNIISQSEFNHLRSLSRSFHSHQALPKGGARPKIRNHSNGKPMGCKNKKVARSPQPLHIQLRSALMKICEIYNEHEHEHEQCIDEESIITEIANINGRLLISGQLIKKYKDAVKSILKVWKKDPTPGCKEMMSKDLAGLFKMNNIKINKSVRYKRFVEIFLSDSQHADNECIRDVEKQKIFFSQLLSDCLTSVLFLRSNADDIEEEYENITFEKCREMCSKFQKMHNQVFNNLKLDIGVGGSVKCLLTTKFAQEIVDLMKVGAELQSSAQPESLQGNKRTRD